MEALLTSDLNGGKIIIGGRVSAETAAGGLLFSQHELIDYAYTSDSTTGAPKTRIKIDPVYNNTGSPIPVDSVFKFHQSPFYNAENDPLIGRISTNPSQVDTLATKKT